MRLKEKVNGWFETIEAQCMQVKDKDIVYRLASDDGRSARDMNTIFQFLTGYYMVRYIHERRMMAVYRKLQDGWPEYSMTEAT